MLHASRLLSLLLPVLLCACGVTREVIVGTGQIAVRHNTAALAAADGNSPAMDSIVIAELRLRGFKDVRLAPPGTRTLEASDLVVEYIDVWRWDLVMYLESISVRLYDPTTGNLVAVAKWAQKDQMFHSYPKPEEVVREVFTDLFAKVARGGA